MREHIDATRHSSTQWGEKPEKPVDWFFRPVLHLTTGFKICGWGLQGTFMFNLEWFYFYKVYNNYYRYTQTKPKMLPLIAIKTHNKWD